MTAATLANTVELLLPLQKRCGLRAALMLTAQTRGSHSLYILYLVFLCLSLCSLIFLYVISLPLDTKQHSC